MENWFGWSIVQLIQSHQHDRAVSWHMSSSCHLQSYDLILLVYLGHGTQRIKWMHSILKMILTCIIFADVVSQVLVEKKWEGCRARPHCTPRIYTQQEGPSSWVALRAANTITPLEHIDQWSQSIAVNHITTLSITVMLNKLLQTLVRWGEDNLWGIISWHQSVTL